MANVELVIKMPEEMYNWVYDVNKFYDGYGIGDFIDLIKNGTPLQKKHGRLIDAKDVGEYLTLADVPTIVEEERCEK